MQIVTRNLCYEQVVLYQVPVWNVYFPCQLQNKHGSLHLVAYQVSSINIGCMFSTETQALHMGETPKQVLLQIVKTLM